MGTTTRHVGEQINRPAAEVYAYAGNPANLTAWAAGLGSGVEKVGEDWFVDSPMGRIRVVFAPDNDFGVLDHEVFTPDGQHFYNPMRVVPDGDNCEVVFSVRRWPGMTDAEHDRDAAHLATDLARLKEILESAA